MKITQSSTTVKANSRSPLVVAKTVPHPMDSQGDSDRELVMVWRPTGKAYPKLEACWTYLDEL